MQYYILSDFHLGFSEKRDKKTEELFFSLIEKIEKGSHIVFLGDIFDFWFEYKKVFLRKNFTFLAKLYTLKDKFNFYYFCGNHDFWMKDFIPELKMRVFKKERIIKIGNKKVLLAHGDGYFEYDPFGNAFNYFVRTPFVKFLFYLIHPDIGIPMARFISKISRNNSEKKDVPLTLPTRTKKFFEKGGDICVLGHFHKPMFIEEKGKIYVNTGEFPVHETYVFLSEKKISLLKVNGNIIKEKYFKD